MIKYEQNQMVDAVYAILNQRNPDFEATLRSDELLEYSEIPVLFDDFQMSVSIIVREYPQSLDICVSVLDPKEGTVALTYMGNSLFIIDKENVTCDLLIDLRPYIEAVLTSSPA